MKRYFQVVSVNTTGGQNDDKGEKRRRLSEESSVATGVMDTTVSSASSDGTVASDNRKTYRFNPQWLKDFPWLVFDQTKKAMFCKYCMEAGEALSGKTPYVTGNIIFKRDNVSKHGSTRRHIACRDAHLASSQPARPGTVPAAVNKQVVKMNEEMLSEVKMKMNIAYCIAKEELPFTKFGPLILLHKKNGINISPTYDNHVRCAEMIGQIADGMKCELSSQIKHARYLSIMIDGDTDVSTKECEVVYVRLIEDGKPVNKLVGQKEVQHAHAKGILEATKAAFDDLSPDTDCWMEKMIGFGADGAAVNMGQQRGVISLLKREIGDHVIPFHCMAHRLELAVLTLQKTEPMVSKVYELLHFVWKTYHHSPKSRRELKALGTELGVNICNPSNVKGTRWVPHIQRALHVLLKPSKTGNLAEDSGQYAATLQHMDHLAASATSADVKGRAKKVKGEMELAQFCAFSHFLADMFQELGRLSCILQQNDLILPKASSEPQRTVIELESMKVRPKRGGMLEKFTACTEKATGKVKFQGVELKGDGANLALNSKHVETAVDIAVGELKSRFRSLLTESEDQASNAVKCFKVFNHDAWPESQIQLLDYGIEHIDVLLKHFGDILKKGGCNTDKVQEEWQSLKVLVASTFRDKNYLALWQTLLTKEPYKHDFENILHLVEIMLLLPISSAQCERGFSAQNRIKNSVRSSLHVSTTEDLIRISTEGCPLETFDPTNAAVQWLSSSKRSRRPNYKEWPQSVSQI